MAGIIISCATPATKQGANEPLTRARYDQLSALVKPQGLLGAAKAGDLAGVKAAIASGANVNEVDKPMDATQLGFKIAGLSEIEKEAVIGENNRRAGYTALMHSTANGDVAIVEYLLEKGANPNMANKQDFTALMLAAFLDDTEISWLLLQAKARVHRPKRSNALHVAASQGNTQIVELLLSSKAPVDGENHEAKTPLILAIEGGHVETGRLLIQHGAKIGYQTSKGFNARKHAELANQEEKFFLITGAELIIPASTVLKAINDNDAGKVRAYINKGLDVTRQVPFQKYSLLSYAVGNANLEVVELMTDAAKPEISTLEDLVREAELGNRNETTDFLKNRLALAKAKYRAYLKEVAKASDSYYRQQAHEQPKQTTDLCKIFKETYSTARECGLACLGDHGSGSKACLQNCDKCFN